MFTWEKVTNGGQFHFHARKGEGWAEPSPLRDTNWGDFRQWPAFAADSLDNLYCAWIDWRDGNPDVYFSSSFDSGKTWSANVRIDDDLTGQEQSECNLIATPEGVLYAFWSDNRDPKTLFDVYCSSSHDGGKTWRPSTKVNDDTTHTFQISPSAVLDGNGNLYVAWRDYRDRGASGDLNANIYFSRSEDGGKSWRPNLPLSHAQYGHNWFPALALAKNGELHCVWKSSEDNPYFDVFHSYSRDRGDTWSPPARVNDDFGRVGHDHRGIGWLGPDSTGKAVIGWHDWREGQAAIYMAQTLEHPDTTRPESEPQRHATNHVTRPILLFESSATLFQDNFVQGPSSGWEVESGIWICKDQAYIGYGANEARSFAGRESWEDYIVQGRFKLDAIDHRSAFIYLRVTKDKAGALRYYRLDNFFRRGVTLEYFDGKSLLPLADVPYPFQKDRWYSFRTVTKGNVLNHFIGDSLLIATDKLTHLPAGRIGVGAQYAPTYFKDILVTAIK
jgi:hypothetical protein